MPTKPSPSPPESPDHLSESSRELWRSVVTASSAPGQAALVQLALEARDRATQAGAMLQDGDLTTTTATTGAVHLHPAVKIERDSQALFVRIWLELGLGW
jgi:phage terminase small subunit